VKREPLRGRRIFVDAKASSPSALFSVILRYCTRPVFAHSPKRHGREDMKSHVGHRRSGRTEETQGAMPWSTIIVEDHRGPSTPDHRNESRGTQRSCMT
jgi:hypothetical protein